MKRTPLAVRFRRFVRKTRGCWVWTGGTTRGGYGVIRTTAPRGMMRANRAAWVIAHGKIPRGKQVLHHCDNKICVRPSHLYVGTHADNMRDAAARNRTPKGERTAFAKLSDSVVRQIRRQNSPALDPHFAALVGAHVETIYKARVRQTWKHVR